MSQKPTATFYNLKAVVRETGLSPDVLRVWERRYGVPRPIRSAGRQRLYSPADISILKWLAARQSEGMTISRAVALWREHEVLGAASATFAPRTADAQPSTLADLRRGWVAACLDFDRAAGETILAQAFALYPLLFVCEEIFLRGLANIGERWYRGEVTVHQEHFASELAVCQIERLIGASPPPWREGPILVGCAADEQHTFGPLLLTLILRGRGWSTVFLGANLPPEWFERTQEQLGPALVVLAAERLLTAARLLETSHVLRKLGLPLAYGGRVFDQTASLRERIPGTFLGATLGAAADGIDQLVGLPPADAMSPVPDEFTAAAISFHECQLRIEAEVGRDPSKTNHPDNQTIREHLNLAANLSAGLSLGNFEALRVDVAWAAGLVHLRGVSTTDLRSYLAYYRQVVVSQIDEAGAVVVAWLDRLIDEAGHDWPT